VSIPKDFYFGETWTFQGVVTDFSGAPLNLSGATLVFHLSTSAEVLLELALGADPEVQLVNPTAGQYQVIVTPDMQIPLPRTTRVYRVETLVTTAIGDVTVAVSKRIRIGLTSFS
jgi:hypothetical protein